MFLKPADGKEMINTVIVYSKKKSFDFEDMRMDTVANFIRVISKPFIYKCNN